MQPYSIQRNKLPFIHPTKDTANKIRFTNNLTEPYK